MSRVLVTGANGFVGSELLRVLRGGNYEVRAALRRSDSCEDLAVRDQVAIGCIGPDTQWEDALQDVDYVIHLAARVHVMAETDNDPLSAFRLVNVGGTINLARQAVAEGVKRFIYLSSIKVNGEISQPGRPVKADDQPVPIAPYAVSKFEAEQELIRLAASTGMEIVIIRPPLVYGPGVKANFFNMMEWLNRGVPLPFGAINNKRSLVALDNLVDLIITCVNSPEAANQTFLAGDGEDLSTTELLQRMGRALGRSARLIPFPASLLEVMARLFGQRALSERLCGSLQVDISKAKDLLDWQPVVTVDEALTKTAKAYLQEKTD